MNRRRVNKIISDKFESWLESIDDDKLRRQVKNRTVVTGGCLVSLLLNERVKDFDFYFTDLKTTQAVAEYYVEQFNKARSESATSPSTGLSDSMREKASSPYVQVENKRIRIRIQSAGIIGENTNTDEYQYFEGTQDESADAYVIESMRQKVAEADEIDGGLLDTYDGEDIGKLYRPVFLSDNAITLSGKIQLVIRFYGTPEEIHENFDYIHCMNYWTSKGKNLVLNPDAIESIITKDLRYIGSKYPICSIIRLRRLLRKDWFANAGQILKICLQISELNLNDVNVLEDQLTGVDTAYFYEMIRTLKKQQEEGKPIDHTYIVSIIDRLF